MKKVALFGIGCLLIGLFFGYLIGAQYSLDAKPVVAGSRSAAQASRAGSVMIDYGDGMVRVYPTTEIAAGETVLSLLEKTAKTATLNFTTKSFSGLGLLVESIGGKVNGQEGKYWQYWVNNKAMPVGAGEQTVHEGDVIEWKFLKYK